MRESWQVYEDQYCSQKDIPKTTYIYEVDQELGGGELTLFAYPRVGNRPLEKNKIANARGAWLQVKLNHAIGSI